MKTVASFKNLTYLEITDTKVTDTGLKELATLKRLGQLYLTRGQKVTESGVKELQNALPNCNIVMKY
jgi:hypothetical protein